MAGEAAAHAFRQPIPAVHRVARIAAPGLDRALGGGLVFIGSTQRHPAGMRGHHRRRILDGTGLVALLRLPDQDDQRIAVAPGFEGRAAGGG